MLKVGTDASQDDIRSAYKRAALRSHPLENPEATKDATKLRYQRVRHAYLCLWECASKVEKSRTWRPSETCSRNEDWDGCHQCPSLSLWRLLEEEGEAHRKARQEEALAAQFAERNERQREDRGNTRAWQACTRARQEAVSLLSSPLAVMPPLVPEQPARPKRKCPGDDTSRGSKLARKGELGDA